MGKQERRIIGIILRLSQEDRCEFISELADDELRSTRKAANKLAKRGEDIPTSLLATLKTEVEAREAMEEKHGAALLSEWKPLDGEAQAKFYESLPRKDRKALDSAFWRGVKGTTAAAHLAKSLIRPTPSRAVASLLFGGLVGGGCVAAGSTLASSILPAIGAIMLADIFITGLEEDEAVRCVGRAVKRAGQSVLTKKQEVVQLIGEANV